MRNGLFAAVGASRLHIVFALPLVLSSFACSSDSSDDGNVGGQGGTDQQGGAGGSAGMGSGGSGTGGAGGVAGGMAGGMGGMAGMAPPPFMLEPGVKIATEATLPVEVDFAAATDVTGKFKAFERQPAAVSHDAMMGGRLKIAADKEAVLYFDPTPDATGSIGFTEFTASMTFQSTGVAHVYFMLAGDDKRSDSRRVSMTINNGVAGPPAVADVDNVQTAFECSPQYWTVPDTGLCLSTLGNAYSFTAPHPGPQTYTFEITTKKVSDTSVLVYAAYYQGTTLIDHQTYTFANMKQVIGELGVGGIAKGGDLFIDNLKVVAPKAIPDLKIIEHKGADMVAWQLWVPENTPTLKGVLHFSPPMVVAPGAAGEYSMFDVQRRFARAHGWALLTHTGTTTDLVASMDAALVALGTASSHAELKDVPVFVESLLAGLAYDYARVHPEKTIGFFQNKLSSEAAATLMAPMAAAGFLNVPGMFTYAPLSIISSLGPTTTFMNAGRNQGALWARVAHGGQTHAVVDTPVLYLSFLERLIAQRMTPSSNALKPVVKQNGYLGTHTPIFNMPPEFAPIEAYGAMDDPMKSWLLDADVAKVFSAFHYNRLMGQNPAPKKAFITSLPLHGKAGENRTIRVGFAEGFMWEKIEFFDMGQKRGEVMKTAQPEFEYTALTKGAHALFAQVTGMDGQIYLTHPVLVVMEP